MSVLYFVNAFDIFKLFNVINPTLSQFLINHLEFLIISSYQLLVKLSHCLYPVSFKNIIPFL